MLLYKPSAHFITSHKNSRDISNGAEIAAGCGARAAKCCRGNGDKKSPLLMCLRISYEVYFSILTETLS